MNVVFVVLFVAALVAAVLHGDAKAVGTGAIEGAGNAVTLAIGLIGVMSLWLGLLKIAEKAGLVDKLARAAAHSTAPAGIFLATLLATACSLTMAIVSAKLLERVVP